MPKNKYDCIVIGSGPGGAPVAWRLASAGMKVLIMEAGSRFNPEKDYNLDKNDWETGRFPERKKIKYSYGKKQKLDEKYEHLRSWNKASGKINNSDERKYVDYQQIAGVGGTTLHFQGEAHRLHPNAFRMKTLYGTATDWPITYEDLEPYYTEVEKIIGVAGPGEIPGRPRSSPYPLPAHNLSYASQLIGKTCSKMDLNLVPNSVAILSETYRGNRPCNYCNGCTWGCPIKDKGSVDVTFIPLAEQTGNCEIMTEVFASSLETETKNGVKKIRGVHYYNKDGNEGFVEADYIIAACGAVETPRLLLNSGISGNGMVGKNFMETVFYQAVAFHPERLDSYRGIPIDSIIWKWNTPDTDSGLKGGFRLYPTAGSALGPVNYALRYHDGWGEDFEKEVEKWFGHGISMSGIGEFLPNEDTFVSVNEDEKDEFGIPVAVIQSFNGKSELDILDSMARWSKEILKASGSVEFVEEFSTYDLFSASHVFGTCRMGTDPGTSVVGEDLRSHQYRNLLVTDASVFPTSGGGDAPSLTIEALSLMAADRLLENLKRG